MQQCYGTTLQGIAFNGIEGTAIRAFPLHIASINFDTPARNTHLPRHTKRNWSLIRVEQKQVCIVVNPVAAFIVFLDGIAMQKQTQTTRLVHAPFLIRHFLTIWPQP
jgi:hypothetical protein